jgi:hypothetical protein
MRDDQFRSDDYDVLHQRYGPHYVQVLMVAEGRHWGGEFLKQIAAHRPSVADDLRAATQSLSDIGTMTWEIWGLAGGNAWTETQVRKLAESEVRRAIIPVILRAQEREKEAAAHIEKALSRWDVEANT